MDWTESLTQYGNYYEGWVDDLDNCLASHAKATVTCYGTRRSNKTSSSTIKPGSENIPSHNVRLNKKRIF